MDHIRIDEGVKRGKRKPRNKKNPVDGKFLPVIPADQHLAAVASAAQRIANGEHLKTIAAEIGVTPQAIGQWLLDELPEQYRVAQRRGLIRRIIDADKALDDAADPLSLARAREVARFARWDAERRLPALFGPKQEVTHVGAPQLNISFGAAIQGECVAVTPTPQRTIEQIPSVPEPE